MSSNTSTNTNPNAVADANAQLQSLSRVSHRLAMVDNAQKLQMVLDKLLPRLLQRIGDNNQAQKTATDSSLKSVLSKIHMKLVEMLSHVMKRVRDDKNCRLTNAKGILDLLLTDDDNHERVLRKCDAFSLNLSLAFLTLAIPRCTASELDGLLPGLLVLNACYERRIRSQTASASPSSTSRTLESTKKQWFQVSHLLLRTLERIVAEEEASMKGASRKVAIDSINNRTNSNKRIKTDTIANDQSVIEAQNNLENTTLLTGLDEARSLLSSDTNKQISIADATYELLLDAFLYQTQVGNVPPAGMSSIGWERMKSGNSVSERDWAAEMAPPSRLATFKNRLLEWIAPNRRYSLFLGNNNNTVLTNEKNEHDNKKTKLSQEVSYSLMIGRSRTVALLVIASGDPMKAVTESAKQYLKQYYDSRRETGGFGSAGDLTVELLSLCVGGINAESILSSTETNHANGMVRSQRTLSTLQGGLSFRRRQVSDSHFSELMLTANKALDDIEYDHEDGFEAIGKLSVLASDKMLSKLGNALGLTLLRGRPYIAAAELLNGIVVRIEKHRRRQPETNMAPITKFALEARALVLSVSVLAPIAASRTSSSSSAQVSEASVAVRDSIYGTISVLCRSQFARDHFLCLFAAGNTETTVFSADLFKLLFRCVGNEIDKLRPRATAALDALLFSCQKIVDRRDEARKQEQIKTTSSMAVNPWGEAPTAPGQNDDRQSETGMSPETIVGQLGKSLLPILWAASHQSQSRQSRVAAARWSSDLLVDLDVINATHILSFLAGDTDVTASAIAKEGLGMQGSKSIAIADFDELIDALIPDDNGMETTTSLPSFWDFSTGGKAVSIKCMLRSYLNDFNGGDTGLRSFMGVLTKCLASRDNIRNEDVIDACSEAFSICIESSSIARGLIQSLTLNFGLRHVRNLIIGTNSAKAKRFLADAFGHFLMDAPLLGSEWTETVTEALTFASDALVVEPLKPSNEIQGAALLGGTCVRLTRLHPSLINHEIYDMASNLLIRLGSALSNADDMIGNVFCDAIFLSCSGNFAEELHDT